MKTIPNNAERIHIFAIKPTGIPIEYEAFVGYYLPNNNFHFIQIPVEFSVMQNLLGTSEQKPEPPEEIPLAVCPFGKTEYDSRIFDSLYRVYGSEDGGTILSAYCEGDLKSFKIMVPLHIICDLINGHNIGALCEYYDWKEIDINNSPDKLSK